MNSIEATSNILVAMINNKYISTPEEVARAYETIYKVIRNPQGN